ncbi:MAG: hydroxyethylthiazole kinase [Methanocalculaceae archaeon]|jgi:hydroxyethylthiazole kinase|nr:hydroxyethylthiazole kinase [Methanocalculaceae archaeon]
MQKYAKILESVRTTSPLVHQITNYVTVNDCANITLCIGASPVMSHAPEDIIDMTWAASALVLNIGTLDPDQIAGMLAAGNIAAEKKIPIILDPAGAGATPYRTRTAKQLIEELPISVIKGNTGEIGTLAGTAATVRGVDSGGVFGNKKIIVRELASRLGCVVIMSGAEDLISNGSRVAAVANGAPIMGRLSGTGCMASAVVGTFAAVAPDLMDGCISAMASMGIAGEVAAKTAAGPGSFKPAFFDAVAVLTPEQVAASAKIIEY